MVRANQKVCYEAMFQCGSQTIRSLASNPKWLGTSKLGFFGVLQTWGRDLTVYHPHIHFVVAGGEPGQAVEIEPGVTRVLVVENAARGLQENGVGLGRKFILDAGAQGFCSALQLGPLRDGLGRPRSLDDLAAGIGKARRESRKVRFDRAAASLPRADDDISFHAV